MNELNNHDIKRRVKINQMERNVRRSKIGLRRLRVFLRFVFILGLIFLGYKLAVYHGWYLSSDVFISPQSKSLNIIGNRITPDYKILQALRQVEVPKLPIYLIDTQSMSKKVASIALVKRVYIRRFAFPARLQILIEEREPILSISPSPEVEPIAFFAQAGKLIGREYLPLDKSYKTVLVLTYGIKGDDYRDWDEKKVLFLDQLAKKIELYSGQNLLYLDLRNPKDIYAKLETVDLRLGEINNTIFKRVESIGSILPQVKTMEKPIKYIDLRWDDTQYIKLE